MEQLFLIHITNEICYRPWRHEEKAMTYLWFLIWKWCLCVLKRVNPFFLLITFRHIIFEGVNLLARNKRASFCFLSRAPQTLVNATAASQFMNLELTVNKSIGIQFSLFWFLTKITKTVFMQKWRVHWLPINSHFNPEVYLFKHDFNRLLQMWYQNN